MKWLFTKHKKLAYSLLAIALVVAVVVELLVGWKNVLIWSGLTPSPVTVEGEMEVHFIDVGNADSILIRQGAKNLLIDAGERGDVDDILEYFEQHGVERLDMVIATHPHADHIGAMPEIIKHIPISKFVMSFMPEEATPTSAIYRDMLIALDEKGVLVEEAVLGTVYELGEARLQILSPLEESNETNDMSVVTRLTFGQHAFLFTGDAGTAVEKQLMKSGYDLKADVLKVSHHGSTTGNSAAFLKKVDPAYAVIPCGADNTYGHPHKEVISRLNNRKIPFYRADVYGDIVFTSDGNNLSIKTEKE